MTDVTMETIKSLRERSGSGMMDCKKALVESDGDIEAAVDYLRKKGLATASKKAGRAASEGLVGLSVKGNRGVLIEINCETDFVARNEQFQRFVQAVTDKALDAQDIDKLKQTALDDNRTVEAALTDMISVIGENMSLRRMASITIDGGLIASYIHTMAAEGVGKIGVLVALETDKPEAASLQELGKQLAMHIAAAKPAYSRRDEIDTDTLNRERQILTEQAQDSGKPPEVIEKMVEGRLRKFYEEKVLEEQVFVMDDSIKIGKLVENHAKKIGGSIRLSRFCILVLGETS